MATCAGLPLREIGSQADLDAFLASPACAQLSSYVESVGDACVGLPILDRALLPAEHDGARWATSLLDDMRAAIDAHPPAPMGTSRFGNPSFRTWLDAVRPLVAERHASFIGAHERSMRLGVFGGDAQAAAREAASYLENALGNRQRIDYGTGHEAHAVAWLLVLDSVGVFDASIGSSAIADDKGSGSAAVSGGAFVSMKPEEHSGEPLVRAGRATPALPFSAPGTLTPPPPARDALSRGALAGLCVFPAYIELMRALQRTYWLEPAGSHGVWGLDDYHFVPFLWGAAQLADHAHLRPASVREDPSETDGGLARIAALAREYMYFGAVDAVLRAKGRGLRWHSPMLDDISAVRSWAKVYGGLVKMYRAEVLAKLPIMQHFLFGRVLSFHGSLGRMRAQGGTDMFGAHSDSHVHAGPRGDCCGNPLPSAYAASGDGTQRRLPAPSQCRHKPFHSVPFD